MTVATAQLSECTADADRQPARHDRPHAAGTSSPGRIAWRSSGRSSRRFMSCFRRAIMKN